MAEANESTSNGIGDCDDDDEEISVDKSVPV
jgi:hypothetical protein